MVSLLALVLGIYGIALAIQQDASASFGDHLRYIAGLVTNAPGDASLKIVNDCADY